MPGVQSGAEPPAPPWPIPPCPALPPFSTLSGLPPPHPAAAPSATTTTTIALGEAFIPMTTSIRRAAEFHPRASARRARRTPFEPRHLRFLTTPRATLAVQ